MPRFALEQGDDVVALQHREMHGLAGDRVDAVDMRLRPARQIDLPQTGLREIEHARAERVGAPARDFGDIAPVHQRREQMMAGGDVELRAARQVGERGLAAGFRQRFEQAERAVDRLDGIALALLAPVATGIEQYGFFAGCDGFGHGTPYKCSCYWGARNARRRSKSRNFRYGKVAFRIMKLWKFVGTARSC